MDKIAYVIEDRFLYWNSIVLALAAAAAILFFLAFYIARGGKALAAGAAIPFAMVLSLVLARLVHWYCRWDSYSDLASAMTDYSTGGYALLGVFAGCALTAVLLRLLRLEDSLLRMLDAMSLGGCAGIALGRLGCLYTAADRGQVLQHLTQLPWAWPVVNSVSGVLEYRLATFMIQAMAAGGVFLLLGIYFLTSRGRRGDYTLLFLMLYGASQAVLDSTRYDSLYLRSNGFISVVQLLGALALVLVAVVFSVRMYLKRGFRKWYIPMWLLMAGLMGGAGYMEYYVQRHGDQSIFAYSVMSACIGVLTLVSLGIYAWGTGSERQQA